MKQVIRKLNLLAVLAITVAALSVLTLGATVFAEKRGENVSITMSPVKQRLELEAGQTYDGTFTIYNTGGAGFDFKVYTKPYSIKDENYNQDFENDVAWSQIARWVTFSQTNFHLDPEQSAEISYSITVPDSIPEGSQYAAIFAETKPEKVSDGSANLNITKRVGMLVYARMPGDTIDSGRVIDHQINSWYRSDKIETSLRIENDGNTDFTADNRMVVKNLFGGKVVYDSGDQPADLLPNTTRKLELNYPSPDVNGETEKGPTVGLYWVEHQTTMLDQEPVVAKKLVLVMPIWMIVLIVVLIATITYGIISMKRMGNRQVFDRYSERKPSKGK